MTSQLPMKLMCINDKNRPREIPVEKWLVSGEIYTLIGVQFLLSSNSMGFELDEIKLDITTFPYFYFNPNRFAPIDEAELKALEEELQELIKPSLA